MTRVELIAVPWDGSHREARMGAGPLALLDRLTTALSAAGHDISTSRVDSHAPFGVDVATMFELAIAVRNEVMAARSGGRFPIVLSGNCGTALGTVSALGAEDTGVAWFDAHGDFNTPETTSSGFVDGTALATLTGDCWRALAKTIPHWKPVPEGNVILIGARDLDAEEAARLERSEIARVGAGESIETALSRFAQLQHAYVHVDLDVLDVSVGRANQYACAGGLTVAQLADAVTAIEHVRAAAFTAYDPSVDANGAIASAACRVATALANKPALDSARPALSGSAPRRGRTRSRPDR